jgi:hypothetical protein
MTTGDTTLATFDDVGFCGTDNTAPGVWYAIIGKGGMITKASTCGMVDYDSKISVFTGACGNLTCVECHGNLKRA